MKIGIYGGTFNPPHLGHMAAARYVLDELGLDRLLMIPAALPPHKELPEGTPSGEHRLEMTRRMADNLMRPGRVEALDLELRREGKSYSADTALELRALYPDDELWMLVGEDMFLTIQDWNRPEVLLSNVGIIAFARTRSDHDKTLQHQADFLRETYGARVQVIHLDPVVEVSSTDLRAQLAQGGGRDLLCPSVYGYILLNRLYGTHADLKHLDLPELRACSYSMIHAKRIPHVGGVEQEAVRLAKRWGADPELAGKAGILHDCTKYLNMEEHLALCEKYGVRLDELEQKVVKLLHAKTGAAIACHVFGMPEEVCGAIFWHTTGKADMTLLEKVVYMADYMEPCRKFEGVDEMRRLAYEDLDSAIIMGCNMSIEDMEEWGQPVHHNTVEARDWLLARKRD